MAVHQQKDSKYSGQPAECPKEWKTGGEGANWQYQHVSQT
jgi:hypothetical protein